MREFQTSLQLPLVSYGIIDDVLADEMLRDWGHWLGGCNRPYGRQSFGLVLGGRVLSVAVSASLRWPVAGYARDRVVELARLASHPRHADLTRVCLRLWRKVAAAEWRPRYWKVDAYVSYQDAVRHTGNIYRFDGWTLAERRRGGVTGRNARGGRRKYNPKNVWVWKLGDPAGKEEP